MFVSALLQGSCSCLTLLPCTQPQLSLTTCSLSYCARYQRRPIAMNETSLHGRDLEGLVRVATGLLASRDISRCRREDQAGPRPTDLSAARDVPQLARSPVVTLTSPSRSLPCRLGAFTANRRCWYLAQYGTGQVVSDSWGCVQERGVNQLYEHCSSGDTDTKQCAIQLSPA